MREIFADFAKLADRSDIGLSVYLGSAASVRPPLEEGERVLLIEPDNLQAVATIAIRFRHGITQWFGVIEGEIEDIHPETLHEREVAGSHQVA